MIIAELESGEHEILFESIDLEQVCQFESPGIATPDAHFAQEVTEGQPKLVEIEAGPDIFEPETSPVIAQEDTLAQQLAVCAMQGLYCEGAGDRRVELH